MMNDQTPKREGELYRVESIGRKNGEHIAGTEEVLYEGNNKILALATLDMFELYDEPHKTAIMSKFVHEDQCWEIIEEK